MKILGGIRMNPLPNIIVIDFCDWLRERITNDNFNNFSPLDIMMDRDNYGLLERYAKQFLQQRQNQKMDCPVKFIIYQFLSSREFEDIIKKCQKNCPIKKSDIFHRIDEWDYCIHYCIRNYELESAFRCFNRRVNDEINHSNMYNISHYDLATYMRNLIYSDDDVKNSPQFIQLMMNSSVRIAEEIEFFEWVKKHADDPTAIRKMPSIVFERLVDDYISSSGKGEGEKRQLLKAYTQTGWKSLLERFQILFKMGKTRRSKELGTIMERYYSNRANFNCLILPLSDRESQKQYQTLITDSWYDLNALSADYLDIYYSETDNGKSGYDIANTMSSLPETLRKKAPCLVIWEYSIKDAKTIPIDELNNKQILSVVKCIVETIQQTNDLDLIIKETLKVVKDKQRINHGTTIINVEGHGNVIGNKNKVNIGIANGDNNAVSILDNQPYLQDLINELEQAAKAIKESGELDCEQKKQLLEIIQEAKDGTIENSIEKIEGAKKAFNFVKSFLVKSAPTLISILANLTQIANYFGL